MTNIIIIYLAFIICIIDTSDGQPVFCETSHFDGIYNFGRQLTIRAQINETSHWTWVYNMSTKTFSDPPVKNDESIITTSFYIPKVPNCQNIDYNCQLITKAKNLMFARIRSLKTFEESMIIYNVSENINDTNLVAANNDDLPWNLTKTTVVDIWPPEWSTLKSSERISVYFPQTYEVLYIVIYGDNSMLLRAKISDINWYNNMIHKDLGKNTRYVGMFIHRGNLYAIGDYIHSTDSYIYLLQRNTNQFSTLDKITVRKYFNCPESTITSTTETPVSDGSTQLVTTTLPSLSVDQKQSSSMTTLIIIIVIIFIIIFIGTVTSLNPKLDESNQTYSEETKTSRSSSFY
ncbi:uncharacterized protein LOC128957814 [Oppia nitens]|uniref:uncharacterized protein LOC128957814 n=1 Tax=Oppia nitens TaxID=1686743 RepID=UPI0023DA500F|nr:uncharacterized protein LOC128957814 [Oppia nitens]